LPASDGGTLGELNVDEQERRIVVRVLRPSLFIVHVEEVIHSER
jgi:hypothetical protein